MASCGLLSVVFVVVVEFLMTLTLFFVLWSCVYVKDVVAYGVVVVGGGCCVDDEVVDVDYDDYVVVVVVVVVGSSEN